MTRKFTRREFLKLATLAIGAAAFKTLSPTDLRLSQPVTQLGRITTQSLRILTRPRWQSDLVDYKRRDEVVEIYRAVVGEGNPLMHNHVWYEIPQGYLHSSWVQPVKDEEQSPLTTLPEYGLYGEVSVPYTEGRAAADSNSPVVYRLYYSVVLKVDKIQTDSSGTVWYHIDDENGYNYWAMAKHIRPITSEELAPISPNVADKYIVADVSTHWLSAFEGKTEVFRTRFASGATFFEPDGSSTSRLTPGGIHPIWSKRITRHMEGGAWPNGYDLPGIGWVSYFTGNGAAIHSTYWHNDFGRPRSHGCLNCTPAAAKWLFRWTSPLVDYVPGNVTVEWPGGTQVQIEGTPPPLTTDEG